MNRKYSTSLIHRSSLRMSVAVAVSVIAHVWIGMAMSDQPIGHIDLQTLDDTKMPVRVKRSDFDHIIREKSEDDSSGQAMTVEQMSRTLLADDDILPPLDESMPEVVMNEVDEDKPQMPGEGVTIDLPEFELTQRTLNQLIEGSPSELRFAEEPVYGFSADGGGVGTARRLLSAKKLTTHVNTKSNGSSSTLESEAHEGPVLDERLLENPQENTAIDFSDLVLEDTLALEIPEKLGQDFEYKVSRYESPSKPPGVAGAPQGFFKVDITTRRSLSKLATMPRDVVFLIDTSGSIAPQWVEQVVRGVGLSLSLLNKSDRFNIVMFSESSRFFHPTEVQPATLVNIERAIAFLYEAQSKGATDVNAALNRLLIRDVKKDRVYELILLTDGKPTRGVIDTRRLINLVTRDNDLHISIYCVGIGNQPDRSLLDFLSYRNKGFSVFVPSFDQSAPVIQDLMSQLRYPLIKNLQLHVAGETVSDIHPLNLPDIHQGQRFAVYGRYTTARPFTMRITGINGGRAVDFTFTRDIADAPYAGAELAKGWAFRKLHHLYSEVIRVGETPALKKQIHDIRRAYKLKTLY